MTKAEKENWITNLEDLSKQVNSETLTFICRKYGSKSIYGLNSDNLPEVYNELFQYAIDAND